MYSLKDFMDIPMLSTGQLKTHGIDKEAVQIRHISVMEIPAENFIRENELILTTAIGCYEDIDTFLKFVREIHLAKAAALAVSRKDDAYYLPPEIQEYAQNNKFPIVMIPWECKFGEIIEEVLYGIKEQAESNTAAYKEIERKLLLSYINSESLSQAAQIIAAPFRADVVIANEMLHIKGYSAGFKTRPSLEECMARNHYTVKLILNRKLYGYIFYLPETGDEQSLPEEEYFNFTQKFALTPLTLWFDKEETINTTILKIKNDFILRLIGNPSDAYDDFVLDGKRMGFDLNAPYTCIVLNIVNPKSSTAGDDVYLNEWTISSIVDKSRENNKLMFAISDNKIILFYQNTYKTTEETVKEYITKLEKQLSETYSFHDFYWGVSEFSGGKANFRKLYNNAVFALNLCMNTKHESYNIVTFKDTIVYKIISEMSHNEEQLTLAQKTLAGLIDKSKGSDCNFLDTLKVYIENNYNSSKTARDLHIHRQSLLYRLEKIEELTGLSLNNHTDLYILETYLRLLYKF